MTTRMKHLLRWSIVWTARALVSLWIALTAAHSARYSDPGGIHPFVEGTASRPFMTRALTFWTIRIVVAATPARAREAVEQNKLVQQLLKTDYVSKELGWTPHFYECLIAFALSFLCLLLFSRLCSALWRSFYTPTDPHADMFSIVVLLGLPPMFGWNAQHYDFPTILLYTLCLYFMRRQNWRLYFPAFILACFSKETAVLLPLVFALVFVSHHRDDRLIYWGVLASQLLLALLIRGWVSFLYRANPGHPLEFHLFDHNLRVLTRPYSVETFLTWSLIAAAVLAHRTSKPWLLRVAAGMLVPMLVLSVFFGWLDELRAYYEAYVPAMLLASQSFIRLFGWHVETRAPTNASTVGRIWAPIGA